MPEALNAPKSDGASVVAWARVAEWSACIDRGDLAPIAQVFETYGAEAPEAHWNPAPGGLRAEPLRFLLAFWRELARDGVPHLRHVDPLRLRPALGHIMLLDAVDGGRDFHVRLYGSTIARISKLDMTGKLLSAHPASAYTTEFAIAASRATLRRGEPLYTSRKPVAAEFTSQWPRLALPFVDDSGTAQRLLVGTVALGRNGAMIVK
jgi:hypothetical protein